MITDSSDFISFVGVMARYSGMFISTAYAQFSKYFLHQETLNMIKSLYKIDRELLQLRIRVKYEHFYMVVWILNFAIPFIGGSVVLSDRPILKKIMDLLCMCQPVFVKLTTTFSMTFLLAMIHEKFGIINTCLEELDTEDTFFERNSHAEFFRENKLYEKRSVNFILQKIIDIHDELKNICRQFLKIFGKMEFFNFLDSIIQYLFTMYFFIKGCSAEISLLELELQLFVQSMQMIVLLYLTHAIEEKVIIYINNWTSRGQIIFLIHLLVV